MATHEFPTVADAQAFATYADGDFVLIGGDLVIGDSASGTYRYIASSTTAAGADVIDPTAAGNGRLHRVTPSLKNSGLAVALKPTIATVSFARPANTTTYAVGDVMAQATPSPLTFTIVDVAGKSLFATDLVVTSSSPTGFQAVLHLFDTAPATLTDNDVFAISDAEILTLVASIPFTLVGIGNNAYAHEEIARMITTVGATSVRGLLEMRTAYPPASGEVIGFRFKGLQVN